jgi:hypothetical protein
MKLPDGISAVTLAGGRTYHRMLPAHEGQHAIRWFIHDPWSMFTKGSEFDIPHSWIHSALAGLERVNPFIAELEKLNVYDDDDDIALHIEHSDSTSNEIAAIISLAPVSAPSRRRLVIKRKGNDDPVFLDLLSPLTEPLHYLLLLPYGTLGWSPNRCGGGGWPRRGNAALGHQDAYTNNVVVFHFFLGRTTIPCKFSVFNPLFIFPLFYILLTNTSCIRFNRDFVLRTMSA